MSGLPHNQIPNDPELKDLLDLVKKDIFLNMNCHHLGTIQSFDAAKQLASATINYKKTFTERNPVSGVYQPVLVDYPILLDCPVVAVGGGLTGALTFPIAKGDECIVMYNDRDLDNWLQGNSNTGTATPRLHSFSDGVILVGVRSLANVIESYDTDSVCLRKGANKVRIYDDKFSVQLGETGVSLEINAAGKLKIINTQGELLTALINILDNSFTATMLGNQPLVQPPADKLILASFKE